MLAEKRLWGEGKTIERRVSLSQIVSAEGFTPGPCRHEWRHGTQECVRHIAVSWRSAYPPGFEISPESGWLTAARGLGDPGL